MWDKVASPKCLSGLGLPSLKLQNIPLRCRWDWLKRADMAKAWDGLDIQLPCLCTMIFNVAACYVLDNGERASFWKDRWLDGDRVVDIAPNMVNWVSRRRAKSHSIKDGLVGLWLSDVAGYGE
jgi:hypothetical protein